jgi:hypothetical protein
MVTKAPPAASKSPAHAQPERPKAEPKAASEPEPKDPEPKAEPQYATLQPEAALRLFQTGHPIVAQGDPPDNWISMGRTGDGIAVLQTPVTEAIVEKIRAGEYYLPESVPISGGPAAAPTVVTIPYASADTTPPAVGTRCSCTMGTWTGEPTSYAYQWTLDGADIDGANDSTLTLEATEIGGKSVACVVTATNAMGSTTAPSSNAIAT